jgi:hypothetical protein
VNGKHGDRPITDIIVHHFAVYGEPLDGEFRELGQLMSYRGLCDLFEPYSSKPVAQLQPLVSAKLEQVRLEARDRGWEDSKI